MESNWTHLPCPWRCIFRTSRKGKKVALTTFTACVFLGVVTTVFLMGVYMLSHGASQYAITAACAALVAEILYIAVVLIARIWGIDWPTTPKPAAKEQASN